MHGLLLVSFFISQHALGATPLSDVCGQLIGSQVSECLAAGNGRWISEEAARECGKLIGGQVTQCVSRIAGKEYSPGEARTCGQLIGGQVTDCLGRTGHPHQERGPPPPAEGPPSYSDIRAEIAATLEQLHAGDQGGAEARLRRLLRALR